MDSQSYQEDVIAAWLRREDDVLQKTGVPTWRVLVTALEKIGQNGIASDISKDKNISTDSNTSDHVVAKGNTRHQCTCS